MHLGVSWAMLAAAAAGIGVGAVWYAIFAEAVGRAREKVRSSTLIWGVAVAANLLIAFVLGNLMQMFEITGWIFGLIFAFLFWLGFTTPVLVMNNALAGRPLTLSVIEGGHALLNICLQGVILASFNVGASGY